MSKHAVDARRKLCGRSILVYYSDQSAGPDNPLFR